ncbi:protein SHQ1 homolog [Brevipalpus obovatus]|uniref:protein SHQ1 homolog n=1 Tax=Brevipalpus obovatus TaxID=246614 RepID=UPI003D9F4C05
MIVPQFSIRQDDKFIFVDIKAPMAKIGETQVDFDQEDLVFWSKPYHLRLKLPGPVVANGEESVEWNADSNEFCLKVAKKNCGQHFEGLDMLTKLLTVKKKTTVNSQVEVLDSKNNDNDDVSEEEEEEDNENYEWLIEQEEYKGDDESIIGQKYGFADRYSNILARFQEEIADLIEIRVPEEKTKEKRKKDRIDADSERFNEDHYWSDLFDQADLIDAMCDFKADWEIVDMSTFSFNEEEVFRLKNLPRREYILSRREKFVILLSLVDILFAYAYDVRTTEGEHSCESGWTISKLSSSLCWLENFSSLNEAIVTCVQRSLVYPLYRNWNLSQKVLKDVEKILRNGRSYIVKCFLDIHSIFNQSGDLRYIFNELFITDYCVWLQGVKEYTFRSLANCFTQIKIKKSDLDLPIELIEKAAFMALDSPKDNSGESTDKDQTDKLEQQQAKHDNNN